MSLRLFAAIAIPDDIVERLVALQRGVPGAKWRPRENLHLTVRFFGEVSEPVGNDLDEALAAIAEETASFELQLKSAGSFGKEDPHTLWVGTSDSAALRKLAADCERGARRLGLEPKTRKFAPHVTLAYLSRTSELGRVHGYEARLGLFGSRPFQVESFGLYSSWTRKSAPNLYRLEAEYALNG